MNSQQQLIWDVERNFLALRRPDEDKIVAQVQRLDASRWLAVVFYDMPGHGAACIRAQCSDALDWVDEAVTAAWPHQVTVVADARAELCASCGDSEDRQ
jgi:hypothetical protein